jgi:hypothetical protein
MSEPKAKQPPISSAFIPMAVDVPDLGKVPKTLAEFSDWCHRQREALRQWRERLSVRDEESVPPVELLAISAIFRQCKTHLQRLGVKNIPEQFALAWLPVGPTRRTWASACFFVEECLTWATGGAKLTDGPQSPNVLLWKGQRHKMSPRQWSIVNHMWHRKSCSVQELAGVVWKDEGLDVADSTIRSAISNVNNKLMAIGVPWSLSLSKGQIQKIFD